MTTVESVTVTGRGAVRTSPDTLAAELMVAAHDLSVEAALGTANAAMQAMQQALLEAGVPAGDIATSSLAIRPDYDHQGRVLRSHEVVHGLTVTLRDLTGAGRLLAAAITAGGDSARVDGIRLGCDEDEAALAAAREAAIADARLRALTYATAAGRRLGRVLRISEGAGNEPSPVRGRMMAAQAVGEVPLQTGTYEVSAVVVVEWELAPGGG